MISDSKQRKMGVLLQYMQMGLSTIIALLYTPIMLRILGQTEYGIYNVSSSIIAYLSLLSLGIGTSYIRFYSKYKSCNDEEQISRLNGLYLFVFLIIGFVSFVLGVFLTSNVHWFFNNTYSKDDINIARTLMFFLTINLAFSFPASVFSSYIMAHEKFVFQKLISMGNTVLGPAFNIAMLYLGYGSVGLVVCTTIISVIVAIINICYCFKKLQMKICFAHMDFSLFKQVFAFSIFIAINQLVDQLNFQTDKVVLSKVVGASAVAIYAVGSNLNNLYVNISSAVSNVFAPKINIIVSKAEANMDQQLNSLFIRVGRVQWFIIMLILTGFTIFGQQFVLIWAGEGYENAYYVALLLMIPMTFVLIESIGIEIQRAKNKHRVRSVVYLIMAVLNVIISIQLAINFGEIGSALGTTIVIILCPIVFMNYYYYKKLNINIWAFWRQILQTIPSFIVPFVVGIIIMVFYKYNSVVEYFLLIFGYTMVYMISVYYLGFNKEEKAMVMNPLMRFISRKK